MNPILIRILVPIAISIAMDNYKDIKAFGVRKYNERKVREAFKKKKPHAPN